MSAGPGLGALYAARCRRRLTWKPCPVSPAVLAELKWPVTDLSSLAWFVFNRLFEIAGNMQ